jgi:hypothetical protein
MSVIKINDMFLTSASLVGLTGAETPAGEFPSTPPKQTRKYGCQSRQRSPGGLFAQKISEFMMFQSFASSLRSEKDALLLCAF